MPMASQGRWVDYGPASPINMQNRFQGRKSLLLVSLLLTSMLAASAPAAAVSGRDASIVISSSPMAQEMEKGETAEYTITIRNTGSNPVTVQLSQAQGEDCNGYTSQVDQITGIIDSGTSETTTLRVNVTEGAADPCETTVTGIANEQVTPPDTPGASAQEEVIVTTSVDGDGSNELWAVELETAEPSRDWEGENLVIWEIEVKNKGRTNATISLEVEDDDAPGCNPMELTATLSETSLNIDNDSSEWVDLEVDVPDGQQAKKQCWNIHAVVSNDPQANSTDDLPVNLEIPELHECDSELTSDLLVIDPDETKSTTITFSNTGNTQWSLQARVSGSKANWAQFDGASSGNLPYNTNDDTKSFDIDVTPDDSVSVGSEVILIIEGKDGNGPIKCSSDLTVRVGQSHGAGVSLSKSMMSNVIPGEADSTTIMVTNQGNGEESMRITVTLPNGWMGTLDGTTISGGIGTATLTVGSKHGSGKQNEAVLEITVPFDALADEVITIPISVSSSSGGAAYDSTNASISVAAVHGMAVSTSADDQTGKGNEEVYFPFEVENTGNTQDTFRLSVISQTSNPGWSTHFLWDDGGETPVTQIIVPAKEKRTAILVVKVEGEEELENTRLAVRVTNTGDSNTADEDGDGVPDNQAEMTFRAILSNRLFLIEAEIDAEWAAQNGGSISLAPGGTDTIPIWLENVGDLSDVAFISATGLEGMGSIKLTDLNGLPIEDGMAVSKGYAIKNLSSGEYRVDNNGLVVVFEQSPLCDTNCTKDKADQYMSDQGLHESHEYTLYKVLLYIEVTISSNSENGKTGIIIFQTASQNNMIEMEELTISVSVNTIKKIGITNIGDTEVDTDYSTSISFEIQLTNEGNTEFEMRVFTSEALRGWVISISQQDGVMNGDTFIANSKVCETTEDEELLCTLDIGETVTIEVDVKPPHSSEISDTLEFTFSAEPSDSGLVGRKNMELIVNGEPEEVGFFESLPGFTAALGIISMLGAAMLLNGRKKQ